ncbi:deaminase domain-containing protein [Seinonella peptonophila]|uniref:deaminase domain-containing protein n=1 Tax=Seinonella peptonophila TaxID=112248 RepID=UPI0009333A41
MDQVTRIENLANKLIDKPQANGTIHLFTERNPCIGCTNTMQQFKNMFGDRIKIIVYSNEHLGFPDPKRLNYFPPKFD